MVIQKYAQTWAGDNLTCWEALKYNIATILGIYIRYMVMDILI